jgi:hypothetical protein
LRSLTLGSGDEKKTGFEVPKEFHISLEARKKYRFNDELFSLAGTLSSPIFGRPGISPRL